MAGIWSKYYRITMGNKVWLCDNCLYQENYLEANFDQLAENYTLGPSHLSIQVTSQRLEQMQWSVHKGTVDQ